ncbi:MAG: hypothetical protein COA33_010190 [Fluviicola sp.]|nr:hypothetical protein [Fluviicola sp.]
MRFVFLFLLVSTFSCFGQDSLYTEHKDAKNYPFISIEQQKDSAYYLLQNFYFTCKENDIQKVNKLKQIIDEKLQSTQWRINIGVKNYCEAYFYRLNGKIDEAILKYNLSKNEFAKDNYFVPEKWAVLGIANCDYYLGRRQKALTQYESLFEEVKDVDLLLSANLSFNIAVLYHEKYSAGDKSKRNQENYRKAKTFYELTLKQNRELNVDLGVSRTYCLYGAFNSLADDFDNANWMLDSALILAKKANNLEHIAFVNLNIGQNIIAQGDILSGISMLDSAAVYYDKTDNYNMNSYANVLMARGYEKLAMFKEAFEHEMNRADLNKKAQTQTLADKSMFYETEFKTKSLESELSIANQDKLALENENLTRLTWILALGFMAIVGLILFYFILKSRRKKSQLRESELKVKMQNELISETIRAQDEVRISIGRDIHDGLCQTITGIRLNQLQLQKELENTSPEVAEKIKLNTAIVEELYNDARELSHQLTPSGIVHNSLKNLLRDVAEQMLMNFDLSINDASLSENVFESEPEKKLHVVRVFQELSTNIVKHSQAKKVSIQMYERKGNFIICIEDDGIGMNIEKVKNGFGLQSIQCRAEILKGSLSFQSENGLLCILKVPLN